MDYKAAIVTTQSMIDENKEKIDELLMKFARQVYQYRLDEKKLGSKWLYRNIRLVMYIILLVGTIIMIAVTNSLYLIFLLIIFGLNIFIESSKKHLPEELHNAFVTGN